MAITTGNFLFYSNYFAYIAEAGLNRAREIFPGIDVSFRVDASTIVNKINADISTKDIVRLFDINYEYIWTDGQNLDPIRSAFFGLSKYVLAETGLGINQYLENNGIQVSPMYAQLSNIFNELIDQENIE